MITNYTRYPTQFFLIFFFTFYFCYAHGNSDSLLTRHGVLKVGDSESFNIFMQCMKEIYGELKKLRDIGKINSDNIRVISANNFLKDPSLDGLDNLISDHSIDIAALRNYLKNSADEHNIQAIKKIFTMHRIEVDDIIGARVRRNGGADFYYYKQKK